ncbi:MAG: DUF4416 family protein [Planctomycetes bacterium]|nr:DUF4416 family protein [Planctomycetota bacterium]
MAQAHPPAPAKLIVGLLAGREAWLEAGRAALVERFGPADIESEVMAFDFTDYYRREMGEGLLRQFLAFERLIAPDDLAAIKLATNAMEADLASRFADVARPVNLDPGYVTTAKLVLASAKDFSHRIYLSHGIYAEMTLRVVRGRWESAPWTFPDYASGRYDVFLTAARERLKAQSR